MQRPKPLTMRWKEHGWGAFAEGEGWDGIDLTPTASDLREAYAEYSEDNDMGPDIPYNEWRSRYAKNDPIDGRRLMIRTLIRLLRLQLDSHKVNDMTDKLPDLIKFAEEAIETLRDVVARCRCGGNGCDACAKYREVLRKAGKP